MPLPSSGPLSLNDIQTEFGGANPIGLSEYYAGGTYVPSGTTGTNGAVPSSGAIGIFSFYGTSAIIAYGLVQNGVYGVPGTSSTAVYRYTFSSDTWSTMSGTTSVFRLAVGYQSVSSQTAAYIMGGFNNSVSPSVSYTTINEEFNYATGARVTKTNLPTAINSTIGLCTRTIGYSCGGSPAAVTSSNVVNKYSYSGNSFTTGTALSYVVSTGAGIGNSTRGIVQGGTGSGYPAPTLLTSVKYTYSGDVVSSGTSLTAPAPSNSKAATCTSTTGYLYGGQTGFNYYNTTNTYTFSSDTIGTSTSYEPSNGFITAVGISGSAVAIITGGNWPAGTPSGRITTTKKFTYSSGVMAAGTAFPVSGSMTAGTSASNVNGGLQ